MNEKKQEIIARSTSVFMQYGLKSVTMDDLARELGVSKKTLYIHVEDKNDLIEQIITLKIKEDEEHCDCLKSTGENAIEELFGIKKFVIENFTNINPTVFYDLKRYYPNAWKKVEAHKWNYVYEIIASNIERGMQEGVYRKSVNKDIATRIFLGITDMILEGKVFPWPEYKIGEMYQEIIQFHFRSIANQNGMKYLTKIMEKE